MCISRNPKRNAPRIRMLYHGDAVIALKDALSAETGEEQ